MSLTGLASMDWNSIGVAGLPMAMAGFSTPARRGDGEAEADAGAAGHLARPDRFLENVDLLHAPFGAEEFHEFVDRLLLVGRRERHQGCNRA